MNRLRRAGAIVMVVVALCVGVGCGTSSEPEPAGASRDRTTTVEHIGGSTTIDGTPTRIVALGSQWLDALREFDVQPVAYASAGSAGDDRFLWPWQDHVSSDSTPFDLQVSEAGVDVPVEEIAALEPDLVLVSGVRDPTMFDALNGVAPVVLPADANVESWQSQIRTLGRILDRTDDEERIVSAGEDDMRRVADAHPRLSGRTAVVSSYNAPTGQLGIVVDPADGTSSVFAALGMTVPDELVSSPDARNGRIMVSAERLNLVSADLVVLLPVGATADDVARLPGYADLPSVESGGMAVVDYPTLVGFNVPSKASVSYALGRIGPQLDRLGA